LSVISLEMMNLNYILEELQQHKRNKEELLAICIQERLNKSLQVYEKQLSYSLKYYTKANEIRILKRLGGTE
jgi:hypothetical protein